jgi:hypothetical protein
VFGLCAFFLLLPRYTRLVEEQKQVVNAQKQILKTYQVSPLSLSDIPPARQIKRAEEGVWLSGLATLARSHHLMAVVLKTHDLDETEHKQLRDYVQMAIKKNPKLPNKEGTDLPLDWLDQVGWIEMSVQGSYKDVLAFVTDLGLHDEWLAVEVIELKATQQNQVHWQGGFWYYKEAAHVAQ